MSVLTTTRPRLIRLRSGLAQLRRRRTAVRCGTAAATIGLIALVALTAAFLADYYLDLRPLQRMLVWMGIGCGATWFGRRTLRFWLGVKESEIDLALLLEQRHGLDRDLVAALQFQTDDAASWGSVQLERAVVDDADEAAETIDPFSEFSWKPLPARLAWLIALTGFVLLVVFMYPAHSAAFLRRLVFEDVPYPTRTQIVALSINGRPIVLTETLPLRAPAGHPLRFIVTTSGEKADSGVVELSGDSGATTVLPLRQSPKGQSFEGALETFAEPVTFKVRAGDDVTRPRRIELVPLPVVSLDLLPTPPAYARTTATTKPPAGARTAFILEGSQVRLRVHSANKPLQSAEVVLAAKKPSAAVHLPLKASADRRTWLLEPESTVFNDIREPLNFIVNVMDDDGLSTAPPVTGSIRIRKDGLPRVTASIVVRKVVPTGQPELAFRAADDFGLRRLTAHLAVRHADGSQSDHVIKLPLSARAMPEASGRQSLDLSSLHLVKGDQVVVTVVAEDERGREPGESASSEPVTLDVTDREGLLSALLETDEEGAERLDAIIRRELGIGADQ